MSTVVTWVGASRAPYLYYVYDVNEIIPPNLGNYIYARIEDGRNWVPIYFGRGDLSICAGDKADLMKCIELKGATHIHLHCNSRPHDRSVEMEDLLLRFGQAFAPGGCHADRFDTCIWMGKSEANYVFYVYEKADLVPARHGTYVCARRSIDQIWTPLAVGQGDLSVENPEIARWTQTPDCTHIHRRLGSVEGERLRLCDDLYANYSQIVPHLQRC